MGANGHAWVVGGMLGAQAVGLYRAAIHLVNVINPLRQAAFSYLPSRGSVAFKTGGYDGLSAWVKRMSSWLFLPLFPVAFVLIVFPEKILGLVYGDKFAGQGLGVILALATVAQIIAFFRFPMEVAVLSIGSSRSLFYVNLLPVVLLATAGVALIASFGIVGVPLSGMVIGVVLFIATYVVYRRLMDVGIPTIAHNTL
jgi:O-antigen/teichoic acid export membrane protein